MLYTDYQTTFTTAFVEFNQRLSKVRMNFIDFEILKTEDCFQDFVLETLALRKIYDKSYEKDVHFDYLQPKVEFIYDLLQHNIEDVRNQMDYAMELTSRLIELMHNYVTKTNNLIEK
jgi:hypothetical protein